MVHLSGVTILTLAQLLTSYHVKEAYLVPNRLEEIYQAGQAKRAAVRNGDRIPFRGPDITWDNRTFALANMCG